MARVFSLEDGNLQNRPITTSRTVSYKDIDLSFSAKSTGEIYKKEDAAAVKQAVKNLLMTRYGEKPFDEYYGSDLNNFLFELIDEDVDEEELEDAVTYSINNYEPRALVKGVKANVYPDLNKLDVLVQFQVRNIAETIDLNLQLTRLR